SPWPPFRKAATLISPQTIIIYRFIEKWGLKRRPFSWPKAPRPGSSAPAEKTDRRRQRTRPAACCSPGEQTLPGPAQPGPDGEEGKTRRRAASPLTASFAPCYGKQESFTQSSRRRGGRGRSAGVAPCSVVFPVADSGDRQHGNPTRRLGHRPRP